MTKKKRSARPRTAARELARKQDKLFQAREQLARLEPGGSPEHPLEVSSAAVVEARAEAERCLRCGLAMRCAEHTALASAGGLLRVATLQCRGCGAGRELYLRIARSYLH